MSTRIMAAVWPLQMPPTHKAVLVSLADQSGDDGVCWPSIRSLMERTCLSESSVHRSIAWLHQHGFLSVQRRSGHSSVFHLTPHPPATQNQPTPGYLEPLPDRNPATQTPKGATQTPKGATQTPSLVPHRHPTGATQTPRTVIEPSVEPSRNHQGTVNAQARARDSVDLPGWLPEEAWNDFVEHRRAIKHPMTLRAKELAIRELERLRSAGNDPVRVIEQSIMRGYQGLFELSGSARQNGKAKPTEIAGLPISRCVNWPQH